QYRLCRFHFLFIMLFIIRFIILPTPCADGSIGPLLDKDSGIYEKIQIVGAILGFDWAKLGVCPQKGRQNAFERGQSKIRREGQKKTRNIVNKQKIAGEYRLLLFLYYTVRLGINPSPPISPSQSGSVLSLQLLSLQRSYEAQSSKNDDPDC